MQQINAGQAVFQNTNAATCLAHNNESILLIMSKNLDNLSIKLVILG